MDKTILHFLPEYRVWNFKSHSLCFLYCTINSFTPAEDDRVLLSYQDGSMINAEGKTYAFSQSMYQTVITVFTKVYKCEEISLLYSVEQHNNKYVRDVCGISNLADEDNEELNNTDNSDEELDESGDEVKDQEKEGNNSAIDDDDDTDDDDDDNMENNEEESSEDNGSDLESEGEKYNALQCFQSALSISSLFSW